MVNIAKGLAKISDRELIRQLQQGDKPAMEYLYQQYWPVIAHFVWLNQGREEEAQDLFQDGILILYEKLLQKDFLPQCSLKTYLYAICRNQWLKRLRDEKVFMIQDSVDLLENIPDITEDKETAQPGDQELAQVLQQLKEPCISLITEFYYQRMNLEQIAEKHHYASPNVAKQIKFRCLERLRKSLDNNRSE
jgi:RNA polymerase sigma factor (sigma-70 family)